MIVVILLAVLSLVVLVAAFLGSKVWHWAHVLVVVALFFASVGFAVLAAGVIDTRSELLKQEQDAITALEPLLDLERALARGTRDGSLVGQLRGRLSDENGNSPIEGGADRVPGLAQLQHELRMASSQLGRVWRNAQPLGAPDPQTGQVSVGIELPSPLGLEAGAILFAFEQGPANTAAPEQGRQYLAEFRVAAVNGQQLTLEPVLALDPAEFQRLGQSIQSSGPWSLFETMPVDRRAVFADFSPEQLQQLLPARSVEEFARDGSPWTVDDGEWTKQGVDESDQVVGPEDWGDSTRFVFRRPLRDYAFLFNSLAKARIEMIAKAQAMQEDTAQLTAAIESAGRTADYRRAEQQKLNTDLAGVQSDRRAVETHLAALQRQIAGGKRLLERILASNSRLVDQLAALQSGLAGGIDLENQPVPSRGALDVDAL